MGAVGGVERVAGSPGLGDDRRRDKGGKPGDGREEGLRCGGSHYVDVE